MPATSHPLVVYGCLPGCDSIAAELRDPELKGKLSGVVLGQPESVDGKLEEILRNPARCGPR